MIKVFLKYNPFIVESTILINEIELEDTSKLATFKHERLQMWLEKLIPILIEECNDDLDITFQGTQLDYEDIMSVVKEYEEKGGDFKLLLNHIPSKESNDRFKDLINLFEYLQEECPFADLCDDQIKENFYKAIGSEFEVSVIATMSSGKSTLINAMLGRELMPAKNEACTATIARIKDVEGKNNFSAVCKNIENKEIARNENLTIEDMNRFNDNNDVVYIDIEGDIPFVSTKNMELVLIDTPGPNNSRTAEHKNHTYRIIKEKSKPMVLYVLNATQLSTNDDDYLLSSVAEAMKVGGKQAKDRFIFAVNKIDTFDIEKGESIEKALANISNYLSDHGIEHPNIYPISAEMAKVIRISDNGFELSKKQQRTKACYCEFNNEPKMHLSKYAPLSLKSKESLNNQLNLAQMNNDEYKETLIHTGVPAVEFAINEYLDKYALTNKVKTAVDTFKRKIEQKELMSNLMNELYGNNQTREELKARLKFVEQQLKDGEKAKIFREKIEKLDMKNEANIRVRIIAAKVTKLFDNVSVEKKMSKLQVHQFRITFQRDLNNLQRDIETDLEKMIEDIVVEKADSILKKYEEHIKSLINDNAINIGKFESATTIKILTNDVLDATRLINRYKYTEYEKTGEEWVENKNKRWYKPWTWLQKEGSYEPVYENKEYVDGEQIKNEIIKSKSNEFYENIENAKMVAYNEEEKFKNFFLTELDKLNDTINAKVYELQSLTNSEQSLAIRIKEDEGKMKWLKEFLSKLDNVLEV